jgi:hypothetical protein
MEKFLILFFGIFIFICLHQKGGWWMILICCLAYHPLSAEETQIVETFPQSVYPRQFPSCTLRQQGKETYMYRNFDNSIFHEQFPFYVIRPVNSAGSDRYEISETYPRSVYPKQFPVKVVRGSSNAVKAVVEGEKP